ncbi:MAG: hypothetical protein ACR2K3_13290, partial [Nocardioides sp.]
MTDGRGLSIFDEEPDGDDNADEPTQVIATGRRAAGADAPTRTHQVAAQPAATKPAAEPNDSRTTPTHAREARADNDSPSPAAGSRPAPARVIPPAAPTAPTPASAPSRPATSSSSARTPPVVAGSAFPVARRGYDKDAVDRRLLEFAGEKDGLGASLDGARERIAALEGELERARKQASESQTPSYAG